MPRCAFLTMGEPSGDDELVREPLESRGWHLDTVPWHQPDADWSAYDLVVIRSTWDYHRRVDEFLVVLAGIERTRARLENRLDLVRWNARKTYLGELAARGIPVVPTVFRDGLGPGGLTELCAAVGSEEIVVKPVVGASAEHTYRISAGATRGARADIESLFESRALMAQPLARAVMDPGEHSLFYFDGAYSHAILKTPRPGDFRSQEEHGARIRAAVPDPALRDAGGAVLAALPETPLYARADFVRSNDDSTWWLMELELIEPSMHLRTDPAAARRFAGAIDRRRGRGE